MTDPVPFLLWLIVQTDDETRAGELRSHAHDVGATPGQIAAAWRYRDDRLAPTYVYGGASS